MNITIWGLNVAAKHLSQHQIEYLTSLPKEIPSVEWVWRETDRIWDEYGLDNRKSIANQDIGLFYSHPVWLMNGIFTHVDKISISHRRAISHYLLDSKASKIADYGGGAGILASVIASIIPHARIDIIEPYAFDLFRKTHSKNNAISYLDKLNSSPYDAIVAQDVLEHIENPIYVAHKIALHVKLGGLAIFANCFQPVIKCHLPSQFYLRHTFSAIAKKLGLIYVDRIPGAEHVSVFRKVNNTNDTSLEQALSFAQKIQVAGKFINFTRSTTSKIKQLIR